MPGKTFGALADDACANPGPPLAQGATPGNDTPPPDDRCYRWCPGGAARGSWRGPGPTRVEPAWRAGHSPRADLQLQQPAGWGLQHVADARRAPASDRPGARHLVGPRAHQFP